MADCNEKTGENCAVLQVDGMIISQNKQFDFKFNKFTSNNGYSVQVFIDCDIPPDTNPESKMNISIEGNNNGDIYSFNMPIKSSDSTNINGFILNDSNNTGFKYPLSGKLIIIVRDKDKPLLANKLVIKQIPYTETVNVLTKLKLSMITEPIKGIIKLGDDTYNWSRSPFSTPVVKIEGAIIENKVQSSSGGGGWLFIIILIVILGGGAFIFMNKKPKTMFGRRR